MNRPLVLRGRVECGEGIATGLGCPTANLAPEEGLVIPAMGVYVGYAQHEGRPYPALVCINTSRDQNLLKTEVHFLDQTLDLNGKRIEVELREKLRGLVDWPGDEVMKAMIQEDMQNARSWFNKHPYA